MAQLEGTENRITVARNRYIKSVQDYNVGIRTFPNNLTAMVFGYKEKPNFTVENEKEISTARRSISTRLRRRRLRPNNRRPDLIAMDAAEPSFLRCWWAGFSGARRRRGAALSGRVVDQTGTLSSDDIASLTQTLKSLEARKGSQIAVLIVPTTEPESIEQFSIRVAEAGRSDARRSTTARCW